VPAICRTIDQVKAEFDGAGADVIPIREQASDELTDEQFEILWTVAVEQSSEIVSNSERPVEVSLLLTNLVDDLLIRGVESSYSVLYIADSRLMKTEQLKLQPKSDLLVPRKGWEIT